MQNNGTQPSAFTVCCSQFLVLPHCKTRSRSLSIVFQKHLLLLLLLFQHGSSRSKSVLMPLPLIVAWLFLFHAPLVTDGFLLGGVW